MKILGKNVNAPKEKTAVALGFFDGVHLGHRAVIGAVMDVEGMASAVFTFDDSTALPKFRRRERIGTDVVREMLLEEMGIDYVYSAAFDDVRGLTGEEFVDQILIGKMNAGFLSCGEDFHFGNGGKSTSADLKRMGEERGLVVYITPAKKHNGETISSTIIRELIRSGDIKQANELLGSEMRYHLEVVHGQKIGRELNFPTINQYIPVNCVLPKHGVYVSRTIIDGENYLSVSSIGNRPTFGGDDRAVLETYILDFKGDLYGKVLTVSLVEFMRGQIRFENRADLIKQMESDIDYVKVHFGGK